MRRGAAWPVGGATSSCLPVRQVVSRWQGASPPSRHRCRAPQGPSTRNTVQRPSGPRLGVVAQDAGCRPCVVTMSASSARLRPSGVRCPASGVNVWCPGVRCPRGVSSVQRPVRASACPGVRCPCGRPVSESLLGGTATRIRGRSAAATCSERHPLDADDALTCDVGGGGEGI